MTPHDATSTALDTKIDSTRQQLDGVEESDSKAVLLLSNTDSAVEIGLKNNKMFSMQQVADALNIGRGTLYGYLNKYADKAGFKFSATVIGEEKFYSLEQWVPFLASVRTKRIKDGIKFPETLVNPVVQSEIEEQEPIKFESDVDSVDVLATISVVEAQHIDPMDTYMQSALAFSNGAKPLTHRDTSFDVAQLQALAVNATTAMSDFTNLLTEEEIEEAIHRGAKRGAMKAALERQAEVKTYEASMGGKPAGEQSSPSA